MAETIDSRVWRTFPGPGEAVLLMLAFLGVQTVASFVIMVVVAVVAAALIVRLGVLVRPKLVTA